MNKRIVTITLGAAFAFFGMLPAQGVRTDLFDLTKSGQELEIMKGIFSKTLEFAVQELRPKPAGEERTRAYFLGDAYGSSSISAHYLYGQGATFILPIRASRLFPFGTGGKVAGGYSGDYLERATGRALEAASFAYGRDMERLGSELALATEEVARTAGEAAAISAQALKQALQEKKAAEEDAKARQDQEKAKQKIAEAKEKMLQRAEEAKELQRKRDEEAKEMQKKLETSLPLLKARLIEAIANHGDSLTHVKPSEYINIMLRSDGDLGWSLGSERGRGVREVISVQKSLISDYKAGRLTLDAFKQKVLQYAN